MSNADRKRLRELVDKLARERNRARANAAAAKRRRALGIKECAQTANRFPEETVLDHTQHVFGFWPNVPLMELAISHAKPEMRPEIKRRLVAMAGAA